MADRTNTHNSTGNGGSMGSIDGGEIFGSWVKYGGNMEGVGKGFMVWGEVREGLGKHGEVWGIGSRCGEMCLGCGERCGKGVGVGLVLEKGSADAGKC